MKLPVDEAKDKVVVQTWFADDVNLEEFTKNMIIKRNSMSPLKTLLNIPKLFLELKHSKQIAVAGVLFVVSYSSCLPANASVMCALSVWDTQSQKTDCMFLKFKLCVCRNGVYKTIKVIPF